jgi:hypothetical protein
VTYESSAETAADLVIAAEFLDGPFRFTTPPAEAAEGDVPPDTAGRTIAWPGCEVADPLPEDPAFGRLAVRFSWLDGSVRAGRVDTLRVGAGTLAGLSGGEPERFTHRSLAPGGTDLWHLLEPGTEGGERPWFCGRGLALTYLPGMDDVLESPDFLLGASTFLSYHQKIDAENLGSARAFDGGLLEASFDGREWLPLEPEGGYPHRTQPSTGSRIFERGAFSGAMDDRFRAVSAPLHGADPGGGGPAGRVARVRFRFGTDASVQGRGWFVDRIRIDAVPYRVLAPAASPSGAGVRVSFEVDLSAGPYTGEGFTVLRQTAGGGLVELGAAEPGTGGAFSYLDAEPPRGVLLLYWIRDREPGGFERLYGPAEIALPGAPPPSRLASAFPNPFRPGSGVLLTVRASLSRAGETIRIFHADGRLARSLHVTGEVGSEAALEWDGKGEDGGDLPAGVYFLSLESGGSRSTRKVVLLH